MKFIGKWIRRFFASVGFVGYFPWASGTIASLLTVGLLWYYRGPVAVWFSPEKSVQLWLILLGLSAFSIAVCSSPKDTFGTEDPKQAVIDEVVGQLFTFMFIPLSLNVLILGFVLFRFFDIVKPFPVHRFEELEGGLGIVADDIMAGILANVSLLSILAVYHELARYFH